jgi:cyanophycinase
MEALQSPLTTRRGYLMPIGGAENRTTQSFILNEFIRYAGGNLARIIVIPTASGFADEVGTQYCTLFQKLGVAQIDCLHVLNRQQANDPQYITALEDATGIFMTGGDQMKLVSLIGGTLLGNKLMSRYESGAIVAGTSAGASAMSRHMIAFGRSGGSPSQRMVQLAPGLGLIDRVILDQHFRQRDRVGRLMTAVAFNPSYLGVGIDEDTAFIIDPEDKCEVIGSGSVTVVDGAQLQYTNLHAVKSHQPVAVMGMKIHMLTQDCCYDLRSLEPLQAKPANLISLQNNPVERDYFQSVASQSGDC